jgi:hypothetical protein
LLGLHKLREIEVQRCTLRTDSKVVTGQMEKECINRELTLERYLTLVKKMENHFKGFTMEYIERSKNTEADELVKAVARNTPLPTDVFLQVISDASIKTVEPEPKFFWQNIICRYGVPRHITVDNAKCFDNAMFNDFCNQIGTKVAFASMYHPQTNGAVERANGLILEVIKKSLKAKRKENG